MEMFWRFGTNFQSFVKLVILGSLCLISNYVYSQVARETEVVRAFQSQWQVLGDCLEVKMSCKKNSVGARMEAYGFKSAPGQSRPFTGTWFFSGDNFRITSMNDSVKGGFVTSEIAELNGDTETLLYNTEGMPQQLDLHREKHLTDWGEVPFVQMYFPGLRNDVVKLLQKASSEKGMIDSQPVVVAKTIQGNITWKYFLSNDGVRLLRVSSSMQDHSMQCDFFYKATAKSWLDLSSWSTATYSYNKMAWSAKYDIHEIIRHTSLPDETFRVQRPDNVLVFDHAELKRRRKLGENLGLVPVVAPVEPEKSWFWAHSNLLLFSFVVCGGGTMIFLFWRSAKQNRSTRAGFTVVELMVAIGIITILLSILLPAVQMVRESGRRTTCINNLRQIALAANAFEAGHKYLPSNGWGYRWIGDPSRGFGRRQPGGWVYHVSPFLESQATKNAAVLDHSSIIPAMKCPSRPSTILGPANPISAPHNGGFVEFVPRGDYAICEGDFISDTRAGPASLVEGDSAGYSWTEMKNVSGVSFQRSQVRNSEISDGLSFTYLVGEKNVCKRFYQELGDLGYDASYFSGVDLDINRWSHFPPAPDGNIPGVRQFGSAHSGVWAVSFCDGSARFLAFKLDSHVHRILGNRSDGEKVDASLADF